MPKMKILAIFIMTLFSMSAIPFYDPILQSDQVISIDLPVQGDTVSGNVSIVGTSEIPGFKRSELSFAYAMGSAETWFLIAESLSGVESGLIAAWDTTLISDGDYKIRLVVFTDDDQTNEFVISTVSVRNYTPTTTYSPTATEISSLATDITPDATNTPVLIPTDLPENPLVLSPGKLAMSVFYGMLVILILVVVFNLNTRIHRK
jgi:hypothetical protein